MHERKESGQQHPEGLTITQRRRVATPAKPRTRESARAPRKSKDEAASAKRFELKMPTQKFPATNGLRNAKTAANFQQRPTLLEFADVRSKLAT